MGQFALLDTMTYSKAGVTKDLSTDLDRQAVEHSRAQKQTCIGS
jgi:hypothetical protein